MAAQPSPAEQQPPSRAPSSTMASPHPRPAELALDDDERRLGMEIEAEHQLGVSNWIPLFLVILPNLGAMFFDGEPESWRDSLLFLLIVFFLYKISKAPWQLYASARTTRILSQARAAPRRAEAGCAKTVYPIRSHQALTELKRNEMAFLLLATFSPALGIALLLYLHTKLDLGLEYLDSHSTVLYLLSSLVKPLGHLHHRLLQRSRFLQSQLQFPTRLADQFNQTIDQLALQLAELQRSSPSKSQLDAFARTHIDTPLAALSERLAKYQSNDELLQLRAAARLSGIEETLAEISGQLDSAEQTLNSLIQQDQSQHASPIHSLGKIVHELLLEPRPSTKPAPKPITHDPHSPGPYKRPAARLQAEEEHTSTPGYLAALLRLLSPPLPNKPASRPAKRSMSAARLLMWPFHTILIAPLGLLLSTTLRLLRLPLRLVPWLVPPASQPAAAGRSARRRDHHHHRHHHHQRTHRSPSPPPKPAPSPPDSLSPATTSPDSQHAQLHFLLHPHLDQPDNSKPIQWANEPAFYDPADDDQRTYQDHLF
ncbi:hypothetical protein PtB15_16B223 [Puccinia triticina]|nr:hypothetical protein PtB15_16B223 [Puccinia triticina]